MKEYTTIQVVAAAIAVIESSINPLLIGHFSAIESMTDELEKNNNLPLDRAERAIEEVIYGIEMDILRGKSISEFTKSLHRALSSGVATSYQFSLLSKVPTMVKQFQAKNRIAELALGSEYVGTVGGKVEFTATVIDSRNIRWAGGSFNSTVVVDENNNLYVFGSKSLLEEKSYTIKGKIKKHEVSPFLSNAKTTQLHYVKVNEV